MARHPRRDERAKARKRSDEQPVAGIGAGAANDANRGHRQEPDERRQPRQAELAADLKEIVVRVLVKVEPVDGRGHEPARHLEVPPDADAEDRRARHHAEAGDHEVGAHAEHPRRRPGR